MEKWKSRDELPAISKLDIKFDIERLRRDLQTLQKSKSWDGLGSEYRGLCESFRQLPPFFLKDGESPDQNASYQQLALTEFDETFQLSDRKELSGTFWDHTSPNRTPLADERFYRKPVSGIPDYLTEVLNYFSPFLHRVRFAKLLPQSQVQPHRDYDTRYSIRLHVPITTHPDCSIGVQLKNGEIVSQHLPADGSVYFINQGLSHWATNPSPLERVHLILSVDSQQFLKNGTQNIG